MEMIWIDLHCHLDVTVAQQGHFNIKSTVSHAVRETAKATIEY